MSEANSEITMERRPGQLNEHQQSRLGVTCQYIDKLLSDMEDILHAASSSSPFPRYLVDLNPAQIRLIEDHVKRLRSQLIHPLRWQQMQPSPPEISATRAVLTNLTFVDIAIEELKPHTCVVSDLSLTTPSVSSMEWSMSFGRLSPGWNATSIHTPTPIECRSIASVGPNPGQLQADLEVLKKWRPANSATLTDTHV